MGLGSKRRKISGHYQYPKEKLRVLSLEKELQADVDQGEKKRLASENEALRDKLQKSIGDTGEKQKR